jgi:hypothetical protein
MQLNYFDTIMSCQFAFQLYNVPTFEHSNVPTFHYPLSRTPRISCPMPPFVHASPKTPHLPIKKWFVSFRFQGQTIARVANTGRLYPQSRTCFVSEIMAFFDHQSILPLPNQHVPSTNRRISVSLFSTLLSSHIECLSRSGIEYST